MAAQEILKKSEKELAELFINTLNEFVDRFNTEVTQKCPIPARGIDARWSSDIPKTSFYMDYSCIYKYGYSKENAKKALDLFTTYARLITLYCDVLMFKYEGIGYAIEKTPVSSARIGKCLYVDGLPFEIAETYYTTERD